MDKNKKIIATVAFVGFMALLGVFIKVMILPSDKKEKSEAQINILTPKVDDKKIKRTSKIQNYERDKSLFGENKVVKNLSEVEDAEKERVIEESIIRGMEDSIDPQELALQQALNQNNPYANASNAYGQSSNSKGTQQVQEVYIDDELQRIMELQDHLMEQSRMASTSDNPEENINAFLDSYNQVAAAHGQPEMKATYANGSTSTGTAATTGSNTDSEEIAKTAQMASERMSKSIQEKFSGKSHFQGAGSARRNDEIVGLIPAETVDQGVLVNGSTIAIRTKKDVRLSEPALFIPKGSVVYGKVNLSTNRLLIDINSYKTRDKLYLLDFSLYDYDGREGIHLGNRTWPKIPSKVANDVYDYAYQRGTQAAALGGNNSINLDEAKDIAILSAAKEISSEIFDKRTVYMPKKYHLWFNINTQ